MVLATADRSEAIAAGARMGMEPALNLAIDPLVPTEPLIESLRALREAFPDLPLLFSTEGLGGAERRLRANAASLAFCLLLPAVPDDLIAYLLVDLTRIPVAAVDHPRVRLGRRLDRPDLEAHVQLVLSDGLDRDGPRYGVIGSRVWRFAHLARRLDFLLAGFGWCNRPPFVVQPSWAMADWWRWMSPTRAFYQRERWQCMPRISGAGPWAGLAVGRSSKAARACASGVGIVEVRVLFSISLGEGKDVWRNCGLRGCRGRGRVALFMPL